MRMGIIKIMGIMGIMGSMGSMGSMGRMRIALQKWGMEDGKRPTTALTDRGR
jgi:hypothetical protein